MMKFKKSAFNLSCCANLLTRQRALFKSKRRGDSPCAIATRFTCQRALCNRGKRQGDSPRVIATRFTCQRALCNRGKWQGDSQRVIDTDLVHGSSTTVQNRVQFNEHLTRSYEKLLAIMNKYVNLCETMKAFYVKELIRISCKTSVDNADTEGDLGNESKVNRTCNLRAYDHSIEKQTKPRLLVESNDAKSYAFTMQTKHINSPKFNMFVGIRSRCITRPLEHVNRRDREPSRIPMKKLVYLMKNKKRRQKIKSCIRQKIKSCIRQLIPKSSALHNLLLTAYRKYVSQKPINVNMWKFRKPCHAWKMKKFVKKQPLKIASTCSNRTQQRKLRTPNNSKIQNIIKCNMQRMKTATSVSCLCAVTLS